MERLGQSLFWGSLAVGMYFVLFGGEYTLFELRAAKSDLASESVRLVCLDQVTDSLNARVVALTQDDATLEEIARRDWGMIRDGEILYRFPDSGEEEPDDLDASVLADRCGASAIAASPPEAPVRADASSAESAAESLPD